MAAAVFPIDPTVQSYDWGKIGLDSKVAQFAYASKAADFKLDEKAPYAEVSGLSRDIDLSLDGKAVMDGNPY